MQIYTHLSANKSTLRFYEFMKIKKISFNSEGDYFTSRNTNDWFYLSVSVGHYWVLPPCVRCSISVD